MPVYLSEILNAPGWQNYSELLGYAAATLTIATYSMKTMIPLRIIGICANVLFIAYGYFGEVYPQFFLHAILLPLNSIRLYQMVRLIGMVKDASESDLSMEWIKSYTSTRDCEAGERIFAKGDKADVMYYVLSGRYRLVEIGVDLGAGQLVGEMGFVTPDKRRTQTFRCDEAGQLLAVTYNQVRQLYFQNPRFGFFFLRLITQRLLANNVALEWQLERRAGA